MADGYNTTSLAKSAMAMGAFSDYLYLSLLCLFSILLVASTLLQTYKRFRANVRYPPGPRALPIVGHIHLLKSNLPVSLQQLAAYYGPLMQIRVGSVSFYVVSDACTAKQILRTRDVDFASKFEAGPNQFNIYRGAFVNAPYGPYWRFMKRLCMNKLFAGLQLKRFIGIRERESAKMIKSILKKSSEGEPCDLSRDLTAMTNRMFYKMALGRRCSEDPERAMEIRSYITEIMINSNKFHFGQVFGPLNKLDPLGYGKNIRKAILGYDQTLEEIMKEKEGNQSCCGEDEKDVMDILLETYTDADAEIKLTRSQIKYFFMEMFMAAVDTTAAAIQWAMAELINNPEMMQKVREEIDSVVGRSRLVKESDVPGLPYLQAVAKETLRLHPPGPLLRRQANTDCEINGYTVKAGTRFFINSYMIMRDPSKYSEPDTFMPERFATKEPSPSLETKGQEDFHFLPFGCGRRSCPGAAHASHVMHATIGVLVQCFDWKVNIDVGDKIEIKSGTGFSGAFPVPLVCYPATRINFELGSTLISSSNL